MQKIDVNEQVIGFLDKNPQRFAVLVYGTFEEDKQAVAVDFFTTPIPLIEPALGFAMNKSDILLKGFLGGINAEFEFHREMENKQGNDDSSKN